MDKFYNYLKGTRGVPFSWGSNDCCTLTAGAILTMTGVDHMAEFRDKYDSEESAFSLISDMGFDRLSDVIDSKFERIAWTRCSTGDLVMLSGGQMGVKTPSGVWVISTTGGVEIYPNYSDILFSWRVDKWQQ